MDLLYGIISYLQGICIFFKYMKLYFILYALYFFHNPHVLALAFIFFSILYYYYKKYVEKYLTYPHHDVYYVIPHQLLFNYFMNMQNKHSGFKKSIWSFEPVKLEEFEQPTDITKPAGPDEFDTDIEFTIFSGFVVFFFIISFMYLSLLCGLVNFAANPFYSTLSIFIEIFNFLGPMFDFLFLGQDYSVLSPLQKKTLKYLKKIILFIININR